MNYNSVPFRPNLDCYWSFVVDPVEDTAVREFEEMKALSRNLFDAFEGLYSPRRISVLVLGCSPEVHRKEVFERESLYQIDMEAEIVRRETIEELWNEIEAINKPDAAPYIRKIRADRGETLVSVEGQPGWISRDSQSYRWVVRGGTIDERPTEDPIEIELSHFRSTSEEDDGYEITVWTSTDIWFKETQDGKENYDRLERALKKLKRLTDPRDTYVHSNGVGRDTLEEMVSE